MTYRCEWLVGDSSIVKYLFKNNNDDMQHYSYGVEGSQFISQLKVK